MGKSFAESGTFEIFQLKEECSDLLFESYKHLNKKGVKVDPDNYKKVYTGQLYEDVTLENIFMELNKKRPKGYEGHSLSVSDVIIVHEYTDMASSHGEYAGTTITHDAYYVDNFGFKEIPEFLVKIVDVFEEIVVNKGDKEALLKALKRLAFLQKKENDPERWHWEADQLLMDFIGDDEIQEAYENIEKYYI